MRKNNSSKTQPKAKPKSKPQALTKVAPVDGMAASPGISDKSTSKKIGAGEFLRLTRAEIGRITWPTRKETTMTTIMVFIMVAILSLFFFVVDQILSYAIKALLG